MKKTVLAIDDEENILELLKLSLDSYGYNVLTASTGMDGIGKIANEKPDIILLDLMLPDIDGSQLCRMIRLNEESRSIPIIMLSAKSKEEDKIEGLKVGADDYITKPFSIRELDARIESVLRRSRNSISEDSIKDNSIVYFKDLLVDHSDYKVYREGQDLEFTLYEFKILDSLIENNGRVLSREELLNILGADQSKIDNRTVDVHIRNIRKKIDGDTNDYIETIRGVGYKVVK